MNADEIIHCMASDYFVNVLKQEDPDRVARIMMKVINLGPNASLHFMTELTNLTCTFTNYLSECAKHSSSISSDDLRCIINRMCTGLEKGDLTLKCGNYKNE